MLACPDQEWTLLFETIFSLLTFDSCLEPSYITKTQMCFLSHSEIKFDVAKTWTSRHIG